MKSVIGIDIGGTKISVGLVDNDGDIKNYITEPTHAEEGRNAILNRIYSILDDLIDDDVEGIGIGSAGRIDYDNGKVAFATDNLPGWTGLNICDIICEKYKLPVIADNDVNTAIIGEAWIGAGMGYENILMMSIGTGIGGAIMSNGKLIRGSHWSAGEIGHMIFKPNGRKCNCGQKGCLEQYISGTAIYKRYNELTKSISVANAKGVFDLLNENDSTSKIVINEFIQNLSISIISLRNIFDPDIFIIGGGIINSKDIWWQSFVDILNSDITITTAKLGNKSTIIGAAKLIIDKL